MFCSILAGDLPPLPLHTITDTDVQALTQTILPYRVFPKQSWNQGLKHTNLLVQVHTMTALQQVLDKLGRTQIALQAHLAALDDQLTADQRNVWLSAIRQMSTTVKKHLPDLEVLISARHDQDKALHQQDTQPTQHQYLVMMRTFVPCIFFPNLFLSTAHSI
eukprot:TRINITY_DN7038_c0_g1_i2.p2 TRINITY_DN7038_c0_g1~~TRINITY_DN7038_c0_g1_i2.p2  ORF type:complete len:162 (+),score=38.44 TRINITY_DN7038_c0_g1_i2:854-1339(+)